MSDLITYDDKIRLKSQNVSEKYKVTASNMNEIKSVVNNNAEDVGDITTLTTTDQSSVVNAINELNTPEKWVSVGTTAPENGERVWFSKGKNLFDKNARPYKINYYIDGSGQEGTTQEYSIFRTDLEPNTTYTLTNSGSSGTPGYALFNSSGLRVGGSNYSNRSHITFTSTSDTSYMLESVVTNTGSVRYDLDIYQIEPGSTASSYEAFIAPTINVDGEKWVDKVNDTGWVDISSYVNTPYFAVRSGDTIKVRRIGNIVYLNGEIYCSTALTSHSGRILIGIPNLFRPTKQFSRCGVKYDLGEPYNIFIGTNGDVTVSESQNISVTPDYKGYQVTNLSGYLVD